VPPKFFITHSWQDIDFAKKLCDDLRAHGLDGFFDAYSIQPGDDIAGRIAYGLETCDVYVPLLSPAAVASKWCELEINAAINLSLEPERNGKPRIIPIVVTPCKLPTLLRGRLYINFHQRYDDALNELLINGFRVQLADSPQGVTPPELRIIPPAPQVLTLPRRRTGKDGKEMILIPAGEFVMGEGSNAHRVYLDAFYIVRYPVTNAEYNQFMDATKHNAPGHWANGQIPQDKENYPVVSMTWEDAAAYAQWAGGRLPTEAEWEKAASWDDAKQEKRVYPWGNDFDATRCNASESKIGGTTPVDKYSGKGGSFYGINDMAGNVWEWCEDWYDADYYKSSPARNPKGPDSGYAHVLRGGAWNFDNIFAHSAVRLTLDSDDWGRSIGFRYVLPSSLNS